MKNRIGSLPAGFVHQWIALVGSSWPIGNYWRPSWCSGHATLWQRMRWYFPAPRSIDPRRVFCGLNPGADRSLEGGARRSIALRFASARLAACAVVCLPMCSRTNRAAVATSSKSRSVTCIPHARREGVNAGSRPLHRVVENPAADTGNGHFRPPGEPIHQGLRWTTPLSIPARTSVPGSPRCTGGAADTRGGWRAAQSMRRP